MSVGKNSICRTELTIAVTYVSFDKFIFLFVENPWSNTIYDTG